MTALDEPGSARIPFHLRGSYAPVTEEIEAFDLPVQGRIPDGLVGTYVRNGANPKTGRSPHWFAGDGMLHGLRLRDGKAEWYRNRWVRTRTLEGARRRDPNTGEADLTVGVANTHVVRHAGRIFALEEGSLPNEVSPELDTLGPCDFGGALRTPFTAHPHVCPETGEMHFFGYEILHAPFVTYHVLDRDGRLVHTQPIQVGGPTMVHDFAISRNYAIFLDLPVVFDLEMAMTGGMPFNWQPEYGARIGLLHREGAREGAEPVWFDVSLCYVFHIMNAWDDGPDGRHVWLDGGRHETMWAQGNDTFEPSLMHRWRFDLQTGAVHEEFLDDIDHAFPRIDDRRCGLTNRFGWAVAPIDPANRRHDAATGLVKYDLQTGARTTHSFGDTSLSGEPVFVPAAPDAGEDDGFLVTFTHDVATDQSSFVVLDASDMAAAPLAVVPLPQRVPRGFHGSWFADD